MSEQVKDGMLAELEKWAQKMDQEFTSPPIEQNFVEITRLPKKIDVKSIRSLVITATRLRPKSCEICFKNQPGLEMEQVAIVEFQTQQEAYIAIERLRSSPFTRAWNMKAMMNPKFVNPEAELMNKWLN